MYSLHNSIQSCLGNDINPRGSILTCVSAVCLLAGVFVNAFVFAELSNILSEVGKSQNAFQNHMATVLDAIIKLDLPLEMKHNIVN